MLETLDYTICIGSTPTVLYFDFYLYNSTVGEPRANYPMVLFVTQLRQ